MWLPDHGFKTREVVLPGIDLLARLTRLQFFRDDGIVSDINTHMRKLANEFGYNLPKIFYNGDIYNKNAAARHVWVREPDDLTSGGIIFIQDYGKEVNAFNYGHESTHIVVTFDLKYEFNEMLNELGFFLNPFERYRKDEEKIANIGGLISAYKHGSIDCFASESSYPTLFPLYQDLMNSRRQ